MGLLYSILYSLLHLTYVFIHSIAYKYYYTLHLLNTYFKKTVYILLMAYYAFVELWKISQTQANR